MSENNNKNSSVIRIILCVISLIIIIISWIELIPNTIGIIVAAGILIIVTSWNGIESLKENNKRSAILKFVTAAILLLILIYALFFK